MIRGIYLIKKDAEQNIVWCLNLRLQVVSMLNKSSIELKIVANIQVWHKSLNTNTKVSYKCMIQAVPSAIARLNIELFIT